LKRWMAIERRWKRKAVSRGSDVTEDIRLPISRMKCWPSSHILLLLLLLLLHSW